MRAVFFTLIVVLIFSCKRTEEVAKPITFKLPKFLRNEKNGIGKYFNSDSMEIWKSFFFRKDSITKQQTLPIAPFYPAKHKDSQEFHDIDISDSTDGFELFVDNNSELYIRNPDRGESGIYFPVYIVNQTKSPKFFYGHDYSIYAIQEALDSNKIWRPIECIGRGFCGVGAWRMKVFPNEFISVLFAKYTGTYQTKLRVRIRNGDNVLITNSYDGKINYFQFIPMFANGLKENSYYDLRQHFLFGNPLIK